MYATIIFLPLLASFTLGVLGRSLGYQGSSIIVVLNMLVTWILSILIFKEITFYKSVVYVDLWEWVMLKIGLQYDFLSSLMLVVVCTISLLVHLYSVEYMKEDPHSIRFLSYLSLFTWFMLVLVTSNNLLQLFIGWEGVGVCSYLLINFWFTRIQANKAAIKAMVVNRVGDVGVVVAILLCLYYNGSVEYSILLNISSEDQSVTIGFMVLIGVAGKSAQIGLHTWLPDAMEGPTPVSALIHAATMVTAGVFLLLRTHSIWEFSSSVVLVIAILGATTAFFGATVGLVQNDIKKVIAYSTCSQLGYMVFAIGVGAFNLSLFHLFNHAFFKALLFLSAGSVIHAIVDEQDLRKMGALIRQQPTTYTSILIGSLALMGTPFLTGFYSKDGVIEVAYGSYNIEGTLGHWLLCLSAGFTGFYSMRLLFAAFLADSQGNRQVLTLAHDPKWYMTLPLILLAILSLYIGFLMKDIVVGFGSPFVVFGGKELHHSIECEFIPVLIKWMPVIFSFLSGFLGIFLYPLTSLSISKSTYRFFFNKWNLDFIYNYIIVKFLMFIGYSIIYKILDQGLILDFGAEGCRRFIKKLTFFNSGVQSGQLSHYSLTFIIGSIFFVVIHHM